MGYQAATVKWRTTSPRHCEHGVLLGR